MRGSLQLPGASLAGPPWWPRGEASGGSIWLRTLTDRLPAAVALGVVLAFALAAALGAAVIATGNLVAAGLVLGALLGVVLLNAPVLTVSIVLIGTLAVTGPLVMHQPQFARLAWLLSVLGLFLMVTALLHAIDPRRASGERVAMPGFLVVAGALLGVAIAGVVFSAGSLDEGVSALKRQFQFWGLMFALACVPFGVAQVTRWLRWLIGLGLLQLPFALYQRIELVPLRQNMPNEVVPVDIVAGTFEGSITGGANDNVMAFFLVCVLLGLLALHREGLLPKRVVWPMAAIVVAPLALGETKLVLLLLPLGLAVLYGDAARRRPFAFAAGAMITAAAVAALFYSYIALQVDNGRSGMSFRQRLEQNIDYNVGQRGYFGGASLNRGNVLPFWWSRHGLNDPIGTVFGHGLGSAHGSRGSERLGHVDRRYPGYSIGLTALSTQLWEGGLLAAGLFAAMLAGAWRTAGRLVAGAAAGADRALCRTLRACVLLIVPMWLAMDLLLLASSLQVMVATVLGLIAWRWRFPGAPFAART